MADSMVRDYDVLCFFGCTAAKHAIGACGFASAFGASWAYGFAGLFIDAN
jgi:hypothetical protein